MVNTQKNLERDVVRGTEVITDQMLQRLREAVELLKMHSQRVVIPIMLISCIQIYCSPSEQSV